MKQPLIHEYNETNGTYDVREMTDEERAVFEAAEAEPKWIFDHKE